MIKTKHLSARLSEIGKIKIGRKGYEKTSAKGNKFQPPEKLDHFLITTTDRDSTGNFIPNKAVMDKLGEKPIELKIRLPYDSIEMNWFTEFQFYTGKQKKCWGDGETATRLLASGKEEKIKCDPETCEYAKNKKCKMSGILSCILAETMELGGVYRFRTHGFWAVSEITSALNYLSTITGGVLQGLPLVMKLLSKPTGNYGSIYYATVALDGLGMQEAQQQTIQTLGTRKRLGINMLQIENTAKKSGFLIDTDSAEDVEQEYYTQTIEHAPVTGSTQQSVLEKLKGNADGAI